MIVRPAIVVDGIYIGLPPHCLLIPSIGTRHEGLAVLFDIAIDFVKRKRVDLGSMVTHTFSIEDYRELIEVNLNKQKHEAVKTVVSFT